MAVSKISKTTAAKDTTKDTTKAAVQTTLKVEEPKKTESKAQEPAKPTAVKTPAKKTTKTAATKTAATKAAAKKTTTRKTTTRKETVDVKAELFVQFNGMEYSEKEIMKKVTAVWEAEGKKVSAIKRTKLYVKPEDGKAYYVINEGLKNGSTGAVDL